MKIIFILLVIIILLIILILILGFLRTWQVQHSQNQKKFLQGKVPSILPDGLYKGHARGYSGPWMGKIFFRDKHTGANVFTVDSQEIQKYPFITSIGKGLQDAHLDVLKIEYNTPKNSFWVRMILDEIVEVSPGTYLGKIHVRLLPFLPISIGYFTLEK